MIYDYRNNTLKSREIRDLVKYVILTPCQKAAGMDMITKD